MIKISPRGLNSNRSLLLILAKHISSDSLRGIFPTMTTPFKRTQDEAISFKDLEKNLAHWSSIPFAGTYD